MTREITPDLIAKLKAMDPEKLRTKPLRLEVAARMAFPDGTMGASGLRKERDKGRLVTEMIARKEFTTLADIDAMRELCRVSGRPDRQTEEDPATARALLAIQMLKKASSNKAKSRK